MQVRTVSEITLYIKSLLDENPELADIWITGEISNYKRAASGHCYFTLQDGGAEIRCVMWRQQAARLQWAPQQGDLAEAHGSISVYEHGGVYQLYVDQLARGGVGLRWLQFLQLKERLAAEGLFDVEHKRQPPAWPKRIGVVTSPTGAAIQDILRVIGTRYPLVEVVISPTPVQGDEAPAGIVAAMERLDAASDIDTVILARGGGSIEDLWAFNDERVARAIFASRAPVISGVGHETDLTITDLVADVHTATPSTAAAAAVPDGDELHSSLAERRGRLTELLEARLESERYALSQATRLLRRFDPLQRISEQRQKLDDLMQRATYSLLRRVELQRAHLSERLARMEGLDARRVLARGFAVVQDHASGERIRSIAQLSAGQALAIHLADGGARADIINTDLDRS